MRFFVRVGSTVFALALVLAACGDDDDSGGGDGGDTGGGGGGALTEEEFVEAANAICAAGNAELEEGGDEFTEEPSEEELIDFAENTLVPNVQGQIDDIRDLEGPEELSDDVNAVLDEAQEVLDGIADDPATLFESEEDPFADVNEGLNELGLTECSDDEGGEETE